MAPPSRAPAPTLRWLPAVLAACVGLGAMGTLFGIGTVLSFDDPVSLPPLPEAPPPPTGEEEAWARLVAVRDAAPELQHQALTAHRARLTALGAVNALSSGFLLAGAMLVRRRTAAALRVLLAGLTLSQAYAVIELLVQGGFQLDFVQLVQPQLAGLIQGGGQTGAVAVATLGTWIVMIVGSSLGSLAELSFYVVAHRFLRRSEVARFLTAGPPEEESDEPPF